MLIHLVVGQHTTLFVRHPLGGHVVVKHHALLRTRTRALDLTMRGASSCIVS